LSKSSKKERAMLLTRVAKEAIADDIAGEAAKAAYYFFLSLFPLILAVFAFTGFIGGPRAFEAIMRQLQALLPGEASRMLEGVVLSITTQKRPGMLGLGLLMTLWSASNFFSALGDGLNVMYDVDQKSKWVRKKGKALLLLLVGSVLLIAGAAVILAGPHIGRMLGIGLVAQMLSWPLAFVLLTTLLWLCIYILPDRSQKHAKREVLIGALSAAVLWLIVTAGFGFYVSNFGNYDKAYGTIGAVIVLLLSLYLTGIAVLLGGEVADVLEREKRQD
jgi:membrane protein